MSDDIEPLELTWLQKQVFNSYLEEDEIVYYIVKNHWWIFVIELFKVSLVFFPSLIVLVFWGYMNSYLFLGSLDGDLHREGTNSPAAERKLRWYEQEIRRLFHLADGLYDDVRLSVFSDHGMCDVVETSDLKTRIESLSLTYGKDYAAVYDSTMARFWFLRPKARQVIRTPGGA